ncbi:uncharacterized protein [Argopecten irradians]
MACGAPDSVAAATVSYNDTVATYTCISGYSMSGGNQIVCSGSTWTGSLPTCTYLTQADDIDTNVSVFNNDMPDWLLGVLAALACVFALLLLTCIICCFMYMCGCVSGPLGSGANAVHPMNGDGSSCCCCNRGRRRRRRGDDFYDSRSSSVVGMRNGHRNDQVRIAGFNYAKQKKGYPKTTHVNEVNSTPDSGMDTSRSGESPSMNGQVTTIQDLMLRDKRNQPAKEVRQWMPHSHTVRNINTSTK